MNLPSPSLLHHVPRAFVFVSMVWACGLASAQDRMPVAKPAPCVYERVLEIKNLDDLIYNVDNAQGALWSFCKNPRGQNDPGMAGLLAMPINRLLLLAHDVVIARSSEEQTLIRRFIRAAHEQGLKVEYVDGARGWINKDAGAATQVMNDILAYNAGGAAEERFDGFVFNVRVEGWATWFVPAARPQLLSLLKVAQSKFSPAMSGMRVGIAVPRWYHSSLGRAAMAEIMANVQMVIVDDYVDQEHILVENLNHETSLADSMGVALYAGVNAEPNVNPSMTFFEEGWLMMERGMTVLCTSYTTRKSFAGVVINEYQSFRDLNRTRHSLEGAHTWSPQEGRLVKDLALDTVDVLVFDPIVDTSKTPKKPVYEMLQRMGNKYRNVFIQLPMASLLTVVPATRAVKHTTRGDIRRAIARSLDAGCDGILVDLRGVDSVLAAAGVLDLGSEVVALVDSLSFAARDMHGHPSCAIVLRGAQAIVSQMSAELYGKLLAFVDGQIMDIAGPLYWRERDRMIARLARK